MAHDYVVVRDEVVVDLEWLLDRNMKYECNDLYHLSFMKHETAR